MEKAAATPPAKNNKPSRPYPSSATENSKSLNQTHHSPSCNLKIPNSLVPDSSVRRSTRPKPILDGLWSALEYNDDDEDEREMKKQKLVQRLKSEPVARSYTETPLPRPNGVKIEAMIGRITDGGGSEAKVNSNEFRGFNFF